MNGNFYCEGVDKAPQRSLFHALGMTRKKWNVRWSASFLLIMRSYRDT